MLSTIEAILVAELVPVFPGVTHVWVWVTLLLGFLCHSDWVFWPLPALVLLLLLLLHLLSLWHLLPSLVVRLLPSITSLFLHAHLKVIVKLWWTSSLSGLLHQLGILGCKANGI